MHRSWRAVPLLALTGLVACSFPALPELTDAVGDTTQPVLIGRSPSNGTVDVPSGAVVSATFSEPIAPTSVSTDTIVVTATWN